MRECTSLYAHLDLKFDCADDFARPQSSPDPNVAEPTLLAGINKIHRPIFILAYWVMDKFSCYLEKVEETIHFSDNEASVYEYRLSIEVR